MTTKTLRADARNRALRTLAQNLAVDVVAAVLIVLLPVLTSAQGWDDIEWSLLGFTLAKTAVVTALSYLMRTVFDRKTDALLPPENPGRPADDAPPA